MTITSETKKLRQMTKSREYHRTRAADLVNELRRLKADRNDAHRAGYREGAAATTLLTYLALSDYGMDGITWISDRISAVAAKKPAPHSNEIDELVTRDVIRSMKTYNPQRAAEMEREFQKFLAGDSK